MVVVIKIDIEEGIFHFLHTPREILIANTKKRFHIANLENGQDVKTKHFSFLMDGIEIQKSQVGAKVKELVVKTEIQELTTEIKNPRNTRCNQNPRGKSCNQN